MPLRCKIHRHRSPIPSPRQAAHWRCRTDRPCWRPFRAAPSLAKGNGPGSHRAGLCSSAAPDGEDFAALSGKFPLCRRGGRSGTRGLHLSSEEAFQIFLERSRAGKGKSPLRRARTHRRPLFGGRTAAAAWRSKPSWYAVSKLDQTISPDLERFLAARMKAQTVELEAGHLSLVSHPQEIADLILAASGRGKQQQALE